MAAPESRAPSEGLVPSPRAHAPRSSRMAKLEANGAVGGVWRDAEGWEPGAIVVTTESRLITPRPSAPNGHALSHPHRSPSAQSPSLKPATAVPAVEVGLIPPKLPRPPRSSSLSPSNSPEPHPGSRRPDSPSSTRSPSLSPSRLSVEGDGLAYLRSGAEDPEAPEVIGAKRVSTRSTSTEYGSATTHLSPASGSTSLWSSSTYGAGTSAHGLTPAADSTTLATTAEGSQTTGTASQEHSLKPSQPVSLNVLVTMPPPAPPAFTQDDQVLLTPRPKSLSSPRDGAPLSRSLPASAAPAASPAEIAEASLAAHVRSVYAHLDLVGVPEDGFSPGVERTRERCGRGGSPEYPLGRRPVTADGGLATQEKEVLSKADRYGFFEASHRVVPTGVGGGMARVTTLPADGFSTLPPSRLQVATSHLPHPRKGLKKYSSSATGFSVASDPDTFVPPPLPNSHELADPSSSTPSTAHKEAERIGKWAEMLSVAHRDAGGNIVRYDLGPEWKRGGGKHDRFRKRCYKGVPDRWRRPAWEALMRAYEEQKGKGKSKWVDDREQMGRRYRAATEQTSSQDVQIDLDVPRTVSGHVLFHTRYGKGQRALFHVLHAFGLYCDECGYCQGMGPIAATFLNYYEAEVRAFAPPTGGGGGAPVPSTLLTPELVPQPELEPGPLSSAPSAPSAPAPPAGPAGLGTAAAGAVAAAATVATAAAVGAARGRQSLTDPLARQAAYGAMARLHDAYGMHDVFRPGFPGLRESFYVQEKLVETLMPDVHKQMSSQMISSSAYATKWYITLFANTVPFSSQLRLWDAFLLEGLDLLIVASVSLLWTFRARLASPLASFEGILSLLSCYFLVEDEDRWMKWIRKAMGRKDLRSMMAGWRKEWAGFIADGTADSKVT